MRCPYMEADFILFKGLLEVVEYEEQYDEDFSVCVLLVPIASVNLDEYGTIQRSGCISQR